MSMNIYEMVTDRIIKQLEQGFIPWQCPWGSGSSKGAYNRVSKKPYSLLNQMLLSKRGEYATFKQWVDCGGHVKKGEKAEIVVFWKLQPVEEEREDGTKEIRQIPLLRYYNVFNISQVEGVEPLEQEQKLTLEPIAEAERIKEDYKSRENIDIREIVTNNALYSPSRDIIEVPCREQYSDISEFYSTLFHEMVHSSGHKSRLDRLDNSINSRFGTETYSKEELIAELGSAFLLNMLGIETVSSFRNSSAYIQSWLQVLRNDNKFIVSASSKAQKAIEYILGVEVEG